MGRCEAYQTHQPGFEWLPCSKLTPVSLFITLLVQTVYLFFETKSQKSRQGDIGAAVSTDGGLSFAHIGIVLDEPWHLSYPYLVEDEEQVGQHVGT